MNVCIPINEDQGMKSEVCAHFGSAPAFLIVDAGRIRTITSITERVRRSRLSRARVSTPWWSEASAGVH